MNVATKNGSAKNGHSRLDEAMALLIGNQAAFVASQAELNARHAELERRHVDDRREADERFARIESQMIEIIRVLTDHTRQLEKLTEAVRDRIGFKP